MNPCMWSQTRTQDSDADKPFLNEPLVTCFTSMRLATDTPQEQ